MHHAGTFQTSSLGSGHPKNGRDPARNCEASISQLDRYRGPDRPARPCDPGGVAQSTCDGARKKMAITPFNPALGLAGLGPIIDSLSDPPGWGGGTFSWDQTHHPPTTTTTHQPTQNHLGGGVQPPQPTQQPSTTPWGGGSHRCRLNPWVRSGQSSLENDQFFAPASGEAPPTPEIRPSTEAEVPSQGGLPQVLKRLKFRWGVHRMDWHAPRVAAASLH